MSVFTKQQRIAELARRSPQMGFTSLAYLMDIDWLEAAFHRTRKDGAPGVDGQTWSEYAKNLEANLQSLLDRAKSGTYRAPPVRRVHIPKAGSTTETRPIGIPTLEDKVLQRAVVMLLEPIYEQDFDAGSYGFRPGRSAHDALEDLWKRTMDSSGGWILEVDIRKFFDTLDHAHLREFLQLRVRDGVLKRLIGKWLKAGVMEDGQRELPGGRKPARGRDFAPAGQRVPALRAGRVVSAGSATATAGPRPPDPLRGRLRDLVYARGRRAAGDGGAAQTLRQVRPDAAPRQDPADSLPPSAPQGGRRQGRRAGPPGNVRPLGFHPLLGPDAAGRVGGDAEDGLEATEPGGAEHRPMVPEPPAPAGPASSMQH